jgi:hypothetical protein
MSQSGCRGEPRGWIKKGGFPRRKRVENPCNAPLGMISSSGYREAGLPAGRVGGIGKGHRHENFWPEPVLNLVH